MSSAFALLTYAAPRALGPWGLAYSVVDAGVQTLHYTPQFGNWAGNEQQGWTALSAVQVDNDEKMIRFYMKERGYDYKKAEREWYKFQYSNQPPGL